jgi:hypothetical protein
VDRKKGKSKRFWREMWSVDGQGKKRYKEAKRRCIGQNLVKVRWREQVTVRKRKEERDGLEKEREFVLSERRRQKN